MKPIFIILFILSVQTCHHVSKSTPPILTYHELKIRLVDSLGEVDYCDRDEYPVARPTLEQTLADTFFDTIKTNSEELKAITEHVGIAGKTNFNDDEKLMLYREHKAMLAITLDTVPVKYTFKINVKLPDGPQWHCEGEISPEGKILIKVKTPFKLNCPICLPYNALIETPGGPVEVSRLKTGDSVLSSDDKGHRFVTTILTTGSTPVPPNHKMIHIKLDNGDDFTASFGHPLADGRTLSQIKRSDTIQNHLVTEADTVNYTGGYTYDILPDGQTGFYIINGIIAGSTLHNMALKTR